ncbi:MAG TPA: class I SAM-dependent methyltransferase [Actinomycetota bacterium]|nr:class I SAM-dependent methyltransferase [Actinomycetota bacterium]
MPPPAGTGSGSIRFDRAAEFYDRTRALSSEAERATVELLRSELTGRGRCLEVGVGTGLISLPLHRAGVPMVGLDLSGPMLAKLVEKAGGAIPFSLILADATRMPFRDGAFGSAVVRWVFHLVPEWQRLVEELDRVIGPGGTALVSLGGFNDTWGIVDRFLELAGGVPFAVGLDPRDPAALDREFERHGARARLLPPIATHDDTTVGQFLNEMDAGMHSWTWRVPDDVRHRVGPELRTWAAARFGSLERPVEPDLQILWRAYDLP